MYCPLVHSVEHESYIVGHAIVREARRAYMHSEKADEITRKATYYQIQYAVITGESSN